MTEDSYSKKIRMARQKAGLTQKELADKLGTKQQNIGRWENGVNPMKEYREKLNNILGINDDVMDNGIARMPRRGLYRPLRGLPLAELDEYGFEDFCMELLHCLGYEDAIKYGRRGDKQRGIDILSMDEHKIAIQCKKVAKFEASDAKKVVATYIAGGRSDKQKILAITIRVGVRAIDVMEKAGWIIWDPEVITSIIRNNLSDTQQRNLVKTYFNDDSEVLENCLQLRASSSFVEVNEHFNNIVKGALSYDDEFYNIEGDPITEIKDNLMDQSPSVIVISGAGGVGKTRRLKELAFSGEKELALLKDGQIPSGKEVSKLLRDGTVIVIDDVHRMLPQLKICLSEYMDQDIEGKKMIILTREYAKRRVMDALMDANVPIAFIKEYTVGRLKDEDAFGMAIKILGENNPYLPQLVRMSGGNALLLVMGCRLLKEKGTLPAKLLSDNDGGMFASRIFGVQLDEIFEQEKEERLERDLLGLVSVIQPCTELELLGVAQELFSNYNMVALRRAVQRLFDLGLVKGDKIRVVPDLLADYECEKMLLGENGDDTGILEEVLNLAFSDDVEVFGNILQNVSQLDWRTDMLKGANLLKRKMWKKFEQKFKDVDAVMKEKMLETLYDAVYYSPKEALEIVDLAMDNAPRVIRRLPKILEAIAYDEQFLESVLERLVKLATIYREWSDGDSPLDVMKSIARFELYKPIYYTDRVVNFVLERGFVEDFPFSPYEILKECLETDGSSTIYRGKISIEIHRFRVVAESVRNFRRKIIGQIIRDVNGDNVQNAIKAAKLMRQALCVPNGGEWDAERKWTAREFLNKIKYNTLEPVVAATIRSNLSFMMRSGNNGDIVKIIKRIPARLEYELARSIVDAWGHDTFIDDDYKKAHDEYVIWIKNLAKNLIKAYDCSKILDLIIAYLNDIKDDSEGRIGDENVRNILRVLCDESKDFCKYLINAIFERKIFQSLVGDSLVSLTQIHGESKYSMKVVELILESGDSMLLQSAASFMAVNIDILPLSWTAMIFGKLIENKNDNVKRATIEALRYLPKTHNNLIISLVDALEIKHGDWGALKAIEEITDSRYGLVSTKDLTDDTIGRIIGALLYKAELGYEDIGFLQDVIGGFPGKVIDMIIDRVMHFENRDMEERYKWYSPVPFMGRIKTSNRIEVEVLEKIRKKMNEIAEKADGEIGELYFFGPKLIAFFSISQENLLRYIMDVLSAEVNAKVIRAFIKALPVSFLWDIGRVYRLTQSISSVMPQEMMTDALFSLVFDADGGAHSRTIGQPGVFEVELRDKSAEMLRKSKNNRLLSDLYARINGYAKLEIERQKMDDEALLYF